MIGPIRKFSGYSPVLGITPEFLTRLDQNFAVLAQETGPFGVAINYTFTPTDNVDSLQVDATAAARTITLPASPTGNRRRRVIKVDASANTVTLSANGSSINGATTVVLANQYDYVEVEPTGTSWLIVNSKP